MQLYTSKCQKSFFSKNQKSYCMHDSLKLLFSFPILYHLNKGLEANSSLKWMNEWMDEWNVYLVLGSKELLMAAETIPQCVVE